MLMGSYLSTSTLFAPHGLNQLLKPLGCLEICKEYPAGQWLGEGKHSSSFNSKCHVLCHHFVLYFNICDYIRLDTSYHFLALSLLLKYSLFFSSTPVPTSSIDIVFVLSISIHIRKYNREMSRIYSRPLWMMQIHQKRILNNQETNIWKKCLAWYSYTAHWSLGIVINMDISHISNKKM